MVLAYLNGPNQTKLAIPNRKLIKQSNITGVMAPLLLADPQPEVVGSEYVYSQYAVVDGLP